MNIDYVSRAKLRQNQDSQAMMEATKNAIKDGFASKGAEDTLKMVFEKKDDQEVVSLLQKIGQALPIIRNSIPKSVVLPKIFPIKGTVAITNPITVNNLNGLEKKIEDLSTKFALLAQAISSVPQQKIEFPKLELPKSEKIDFTPLLEAIQSLESALGKKTDSDTVPAIRDLKKVMQAIADKPTFTPTPVTNVNINGLSGFAKSTAQTVGTTVSKLPSYGQLFNRRSIIIFNNSSTITIYVGGSDVTSVNGLPILPQTFSPAIDAGYNMVIYGITASSTADVRVVEVSKDASATVQQ